MSVWLTMAGAGRIRLLTLLHAGYPNFVKFILIFWIPTFFVYLNKNKLQDTFRGRVCECPVVQGVKFSGDGYTHCQGNLLPFLPE